MRNSKKVIPLEMRDEIVSMYLNGENSYEELGKYYKVGPSTIRTWVCRYRKTKKVVSLQSKSKPHEDMSRKKREPEKTSVVVDVRNHLVVLVRLDLQSSLTE